MDTKSVNFNGFDLSQLNPYETSGTLHYFVHTLRFTPYLYVNYAVTASRKSLMNNLIAKEHYFDAFDMKFAFVQLHNDLNHVLSIFTCLRILFRSIKRKLKLIISLLFRKTLTQCD